MDDWVGQNRVIPSIFFWAVYGYAQPLDVVSETEPRLGQVQRQVVLQQVVEGFVEEVELVPMAALQSIMMKSSQLLAPSLLLTSMMLPSTLFEKTERYFLI